MEGEEASLCLKNESDCTVFAVFACCASKKIVGRFKGTRDKKRTDLG